MPLKRIEAMRPEATLSATSAISPLRWRRFIPAVLTAIAVLAATLLVFFVYRNYNNPLVQEASLYLLSAGLLATGLAFGLVLVWTLFRECKRTEVELRTSRAQLSRVIDGSNDGFWDWHVPSGTTQHNERWAEMLG